MFKKLLISILISFVFLTSFARFSHVSAQETWYNQTFNSWYNKVYDTSNPSEIFGERYTTAQVQWIFYGFFSFLINSATGPESTEAIQCFLTNSGDIDTCVEGVKGFLSFSNSTNNTLAEQNETTKDESLVSLVFASNRPLSGISYVKETVEKLNPVSEVKAQSVGFGYDALSVIQDMWKAVRNIAFGLFVLATIVIAFMIMFRVKISPQVVISVQSALPKLVTALILVTFSYAIAGFLIDLMYVVIGLLSLTLSPFASVAFEGFDASRVFSFLTTGPNGSGIFGGMVIFFGLFTFTAVAVSTAYMGALLSLALSPISLILVIIAMIVLIVIAVINSLKTFFSLVKAFASILLLTIAAPLQIVAGVIIPNLGFGAWLRSFLASISTFVVTGLLLFMSLIFLAQSLFITFGDYFSDGFLASVPKMIFGSGFEYIGGAPSTTNSWPPLIGAVDNSAGTGLLFLGVSFILFTLIPKATEIVQGFITGKPFAYGTAIGETFGPAKLGAAYTFNTMAQKGELPLPLQSLVTRLMGGKTPNTQTIKTIGETGRTMFGK